MIFGANLKKISVSAGTISLLALFFIPVLAFTAPTPDTVARNTGITYECVNGDCTFADLIAGTQKVVKWGSIFALEFSVVVIAYAGFNYMISGAYPNKRKEANDMLRKAVIGIIFILAAWLIVTLITNGLNVQVDTFLK